MVKCLVKMMRDIAFIALIMLQEMLLEIMIIVAVMYLGLLKGIVIMAAWGTPSMFLISCGELFNMVMSRSILMKRIVFIVWINLQDGELMPIMN